MTRMADGWRTTEWRSQLLYQRRSDREIGQEREVQWTGLSAMGDLVRDRAGVFEEDDQQEAAKSRC